MQKFTWKPIIGYEGFYEVSENGLVRSIDRVVPLSGGGGRTVSGRILLPKKNNFGYLSVHLSKNGRLRTHFIHRLVAQAFISNPNNLPQVNHLSGDKRDNRKENLEWTDASGNALHAYATGLNSNKGGKHKLATGVIDNVSGQTFSTIREFCDHYGINYQTGRNALNGYSPFPKVIDLTKHSFQKIKPHE